MRADKLTKRLVEKFGTESVLVRSQFHLQVVIGKKKNDIWLTKDGDIKFQPHGMRGAQYVSFDILMKRLGNPLPKSHLDKMRDMLNVAQFVKDCEIQSEKVGSAIFVDAGFKDGKARIASVFVDETNIDAKSKVIDASDSYQAELSAIELGMSMNDSVIIYSDCKGAVESLKNDRVKWLPRTHNRAADRLGNMRRKSGLPVHRRKSQ